ncbi:MAG: uracil-DNA glycosylase [Spirochaetae bacterium HGW-Spirochaetae-8]|nr:MAG: uracil-DNA glycosylase [Spirochaetae bacterium HGW-Spirochaetae-8]
MNDEVQRKRENLSSALAQVWDLCQDTQRYFDAQPAQNREACPDLSQTVARLVPSEIDAQAARLDTTSLSQLVTLVESCRNCGLGGKRIHAVPGEGVMNPRVMVIGEGPGADEDASGRPFVGKAGQYLEKWLAAVGLSRDRNVYIANIVKCRPPGNRDPLPEEAAACIPYLKRQIQLVKPEAILCVGRIAAQFLLHKEEGVGKLRGSFHRFEGIPVLVTYHPAGVLRNTELRGAVWEDMQRLAGFLQLPIPTRKG